MRSLLLLWDSALFRPAPRFPSRGLRAFRNGSNHGFAQSALKIASGHPFLGQQTRSQGTFPPGDYAARRTSPCVSPAAFVLYNILFYPWIQGFLFCSRVNSWEEEAPPRKSPGARLGASAPQLVPQPSRNPPAWLAKMTCGIRLESYKVGMFIARRCTGDRSSTSMHAQSDEPSHIYTIKQMNIQLTPIHICYLNPLTLASYVN